MAGAFVLQFRVDGDVQLARGFSRFADDVKDLSDAFREIAKDFHEGEQKQFETKGAYGVGGWQALAPTTIERKERGGYPMDILVRSGKLKRTLTGKTVGSIEEVRPLELRVGTEVPYAIFHQRSTRHMPARPVIKLPEEQKTRWHKIIHKWLVKAIKKEFVGLMPTERAGIGAIRGMR